MSNEELVELIQQSQDVSRNMEQLYLQNKGLVFSIVKRYRYACQSDYNSIPVIEMDELMHEAYFGLIKAVESYDSSQGILFMTYATPCIRQVVKRFLENCGQVVRVPVHMQQKIYQYNRITGHFLQYFNRKPTVQEYARYLGESVKGVEHLQYFMYQENVKSLDEAVPGGEDENLSFVDGVASDVNIESDVVEKLSRKQLKEELWDMVAYVLKDDKMIATIRYRFIDRLTLEEIGKCMGVTRNVARQYESKALRRLRCNSKTKRLIDYLVA